MAHDRHIQDGQNKDLLLYSKQDYLAMTSGEPDIFNEPVVQQHNGFNVVRDDHLVGAKARFGQWLFRALEPDTVVYVQPRAGLAGVSLLKLAQKFNKNIVLFMPSSKQISMHQAICIERGATPKFRRIAAMPNLNKYASEWAREHDAFFVPLGLYHPLVVAGAVRTAHELARVHGEPEEFWTVFSTGVLTRGLQIGWPGAKAHTVAVARNAKQGELGAASVYSHPYQFLKNEDKDLLPPFPTVNNYDAKAWRYMSSLAKPGAWFYNVGKEPELNDLSIIETTDSQREWNEIRD